MKDSEYPLTATISRRCLLPSELVISLTVLVSIFFLCFLYPLLFPLTEPVGGDIRESGLPVLSPGHFLGTDLNGNDVFSRLLYGGRTSLLIAIATNALGLLIGASLGAWSAYCGGMIDSATMRILDTLIAFPSLVLVLAIANAFEASPSSMVFALLFYSVPAYARIARASTLRLCGQPFMLAAQLAGTSTPRILSSHLAPNIMPELFTFAMLGMGATIIIEGALNFLGLGIQLPAPSWGGMIYQGQQAISFKPSLVLLPSACLFITVLSFNHLGDVLRSKWGER